MPMEIDRKLLKQRAREAMSLSKPAFWIVTAVYLLLTTGVSYVAGMAPTEVSLFLEIAFLLYSLVMGFGFRLWALWTSRRWEPGLGSLMEGFSVAGRVVMMEAMIFLRVFGFTILLSLGASMVILLVNGSPLAVLLVLLAIVGVEIFALRYTLAPYLLADHPDLGPAVAIHRSVRLTKGWVWELVKLQLSFAGWYVLVYALTAVGLVVGGILSGGADLGALMSMDYAAMVEAVGSLTSAPLTSILSNLLPLPVLLYFTPYLEVTLAEFYNARIAQPGAMEDEFSNIRMPEL